MLEAWYPIASNVGCRRRRIAQKQRHRTVKPPTWLKTDPLNVRRESVADFAVTRATDRHIVWAFP